MKTPPSLLSVERPLLTSGAVMRRLGYADNTGFMRFLKSSDLPWIRLNARRFMFDPQQLDDWLARHTVGKTNGGPS